LNVTVRELKKIGRREGEEEYDRAAIHRYLSDRARDAIDRTDFSPLDTLLADDFNVRTLCGWARHQYGLEITPDEIGTYEEIEEPIDLLRERVRQQYREQEIKFPVAVGMTRFMGGQGQHSDRGGLIRWASDRFHTQLSEADFKEKERPQVEELLLSRSRSYLPDEAGVVDQVEQYLNQAYYQTGANGNGAVNNEALAELVEFANREFAASLDVEELKPLDRESARQAVLQCFDRRYRPELGQAERALLLEVLDTAWKEHLYYMDHLRQGIGLVGYAQKDPKVEYKREGMKAFESMWDRIGEQVTSAIFRLEKESPQFVGSLWEITSTTHGEAAPAAQEYQEQQQQQESNQLEPGQEPAAVEPIRNRQEKVGRNDPCPCGSGKKYKKCHGAKA
ncbi:MAG: SEC-C metal-binding domain-containing protein, partial [Maioricimonas sp. JB049]